MVAEEEIQESRLKPIPLYRLVIDQARITPDVQYYPYQGSGTREDPFIVTWIPNDPGNPLNWTTSLRWTIISIVGIENLATSYASSTFSGTAKELSTDLGASSELIAAGVSLFVLGFAVGPLIWAPLSEFYGRQIIFAITFTAFTAFNAGCVGSSTTGGLLVLRFFGGAFSSSSLTNAGGVVADVCTISQRGMAMTIFSMAPSMGPVFGPFTAGFLGGTQGWRWVMASLTIFSGFSLTAGLLLVPETYAPVILRKRAAVLSTRMGRVYTTKIGIDKGHVSLKSAIRITLARPWKMLFLEPIVLLMTIYLSIVYGTLYLLFSAYPIVFQQIRGWSAGIGGLPFLGVAVGMFIAAGVSAWITRKSVEVATRRSGIISPEVRLLPVMVGAIPIPIAMFWFAWTSYPPIHWMSPVWAGVPFGFGLNLIFTGTMSYLIDSYTIFAASALAANTTLRSLFAAVFPLFTERMYKSLGVHWAGSIPGFLAVACIPFPFIFHKHGAQIRRRCVYAARAEAATAGLSAGATDSTER